MIDHFQSMAPETKAAIDLSMITVMLGTLADLLPELAALSTLIWTIIRIYETETVKGWLGKSKD